MDIQDLEVLQGKPMFCSRATRPSPAMSCSLIFQPPSLLSVCTSRKPSKTGTSPQLSPSSPAAPWPPAAQNNFPLLLPAGISYPMEIKLVKCRKPVPGPETTWLAGKQIFLPAKSFSSLLYLKDFLSSRKFLGDSCASVFVFPSLASFSTSGIRLVTTNSSAAAARSFLYRCFCSKFVFVTNVFAL